MTKNKCIICKKDVPETSTSQNICSDKCNQTLLFGKDFGKDNREKIKDYVKRVSDKSRRDALQSLFNMLDSSKYNFFEKPAAKKHHHAYKKGLAEHTVEVVENAINLNDVLECGFNQDSIIISALLHDVGKVYVYSFEETENTQDEIMVHKTIASQEALIFRLCAKAGLTITPEEISAIEFAHGGWSSLARDRSIQPHPLSVLIHCADNLSAAKEKFKRMKEGKL